MADIKAIADAIATRFGAALITPPTGYADIALATADLPDALTSLPAVLVFPPTGSWTWSPGAQMVGDLEFPVRFYYGPRPDTGRAATAVNDWYYVLLERLIGNLALGQSSAGVTHSFITGSQAGTLTYADKEYVGIEFAALVHLVVGIDPVQ